MRLRLLAASAALATVGLVSSVASANCGPRSNIDCWAIVACFDANAGVSAMGASVHNACYNPGRDPELPCTYYYLGSAEYRQIQCDEASVGQ